MSDSITTIYVTKYALSSGIKRTDVCIRVDGTAVEITGWIRSYFHKGDFALTLDEAIADAENRRVKKIASLEKQIAKLRKLKFGATSP